MFKSILVWFCGLFGLEVLEKSREIKPVAVKGRPKKENGQKASLSKPVRWVDHDYEKVKEAAAVMGQPVSLFIRESSLAAAEKIITSGDGCF